MDTAKLTRTTHFPTLLAFIACCGLLTTAYLFKTIMGLEPCPLCIIQRLFVVALAIVFLIALMHGPKRWGHIVYGVVGLVLSLSGGLVALRQVWLQLHPQQGSVCAPGFTTVLQRLPLTETLRVLLTGSGDCAKVSWHWLGLSMAGWMIIVFALFAIFTLWLIVRKPHRAS